jgi:hypothetical protein
MASFARSAFANCLGGAFLTLLLPGGAAPAATTGKSPKAPCPPGYAMKATGVCGPTAPPKAACPPGYTMKAAGVCGPSAPPKAPCPPGYTMQATGTCKPTSPPKPAPPVCPRGQTPDRQGNCPR